MNITRPQQLSTFIKEHRKKHGITQTEIAKLVGIRAATISDFENKPESCKLETFFKILAALNLKVDVAARDQVPNDKLNQWTVGW